MTEKATRHYYAEFCPYGTDTISDGDTLMRFATREERDDMVKRINDADGDRAQAVTLAEVSHRYNVRKFFDDPFGDCVREVDGLKTCAGRPFYEICHRRGYMH